MEEEILTPYLHQLLPASHIQLDVEASDWRDAIAKSAKPLVTMGHIEPRYIQAMIENVERHGPYVVLVPHFAIPHEAPEYGVYKMGMNLIGLTPTTTTRSSSSAPWPPWTTSPTSRRSSTS